MLLCPRGCNDKVFLLEFVVGKVYSFDLIVFIVDFPVPSSQAFVMPLGLALVQHVCIRVFVLCGVHHVQDSFHILVGLLTLGDFKADFVVIKVPDVKDEQLTFCSCLLSHHTDLAWAQEMKFVCFDIEVKVW